MPDVVTEDINKFGHKIVKIYYGEYQGENKFVNLTVKQAAAVADNIDALRAWVDRNERK